LPSFEDVVADITRKSVAELRSAQVFEVVEAVAFGVAALAWPLRMLMTTPAVEPL
jgi:hypothetical protein